MIKHTRRLGASIFLTAAILAACNSEAKKGPDSTALGADSALNRDLAMANKDTAAQPALKDVPKPAEAPAPKTDERPRRTPA